MTHAFSSIDELGDGPGFRKVRGALGVTAFGVNAVVYPPHFEGFHHYHDTQDELYFVHRGRVQVEVEGETRELGEGGLFHAESTTPRKVSNPSATATWSIPPTSSGAPLSARSNHSPVSDTEYSVRRCQTPE